MRDKFDKSTFIGMGIFIFVVLGGIILINSNNYENNSDKNVRSISIDAKWFEFNPNEIILKQGEEVEITINNLDVDHGITIPELGVSGNNFISFTADKKGEFMFYCDNFCGVDHDDMVGRIIVK